MGCKKLETHTIKKQNPHLLSSSQKTDITPDISQIIESLPENPDLHDQDSVTTIEQQIDPTITNEENKMLFNANHYSIFSSIVSSLMTSQSQAIIFSHDSKLSEKQKTRDTITSTVLDQEHIANSIAQVEQPLSLYTSKTIPLK
ncbi:hypothetical protein [Liberibacter crescens]|nr:hypothetical protein [Liberibacter crescens]